MSPCKQQRSQPTSEHLLISLHYLPCLAYFVRLLPYDTIELEACDYYQRQTYRNRCYILASQRIERLTVPVEYGEGRVSYRDVPIYNRQSWATRHWHTLCTAYSKAPYFEHYAPHLQRILQGQHDTLWALNLALLKTLLKLLKLKKRVVHSKRYKPYSNSEASDARYELPPHPELYKVYCYQPTPYYQVFGKRFKPNLSIVDLLFCEGPQAAAILQASIPTPERDLHLARRK